MLGNFISSFITVLFGIGVGYAFVLGVKPEKRRPVVAILIEVLTFALGAAASEIAFGLYPDLKQGWKDLATGVVFVWLIFLPGCYISTRIRLRRDHVV